MPVIGQRNMALVYQNDPFGKSGLLADEGVFAKARITPLTQIPLERDASNAPAVVAALSKLSGLNRHHSGGSSASHRPWSIHRTAKGKGRDEHTQQQAFRYL